MKNKWLVCNDNDLKVTKLNPLGGYLFLYESTPMNIPQERLTELLVGIGEMNQQEIDINNPIPNRGPNTPNISEEKPKPTPQKKEPDLGESVSVLNLSRFETIKLLEKN